MAVERRRKVLVVDDEESVRNLLQRALEEAGYQVTTATSGEEAMSEAYHGEGVELVLLDIKMPGMSGMDVLTKLTTDWPDTCVIMATAVVDVETAIKAMKLGAYDYITKPFNLDEVVLTVQRALERRDLQLQRKQYYLQIEQSVRSQTERMQAQFTELVNSLAREHKLLLKLAGQQTRGEESLLSKLPKELQEPKSSVEEFRDALLKILKRA